MLKILKNLFVFFIPIQCFCQNIEYKIDRELKVVKVFDILKLDTTLRYKRIYDNGRIIQETSFYNNEIIGETNYQYNNTFSMFVTQILFKEGDTAKTYITYLYDQKGKEYYRQRIDSSKDGTSIYYIVQDYVYKDSLLEYSNWVSTHFPGFQNISTKYEYNKNKELIRKYISTDLSGEYKLDGELTYDKKCNLIKRTFNSGFIEYSYDNDDKLIKEYQQFNTQYLPQQEEIIEYYYDNFKRLSEIKHNHQKERYSTLYRFIY